MFKVLATKHKINKIKSIVRESKLLCFSFLYIYMVKISLLLTRIIGYCTNDSGGYIKFPFKDYLSFNFSSSRTPLYPLIIKLCNNNLYLVCVLQMIVSMISMIYLYKTLLMLTKNNKNISLILIILFGTMDAINGWDFCILTESLSISGTIYFFHFIVRFIKLEHIIDGVHAVLICFMLTFLRPTFLLFVYIILVFLILRSLLKKGNAKNNIHLIIVSLVTITVIFSYQFIYLKCNGIFALSDILVKNELLIMIDQGYYLNSEDPLLISLIEDNQKDLWGKMANVVHNYGLKESAQIYQKCIKNNFNIYITDILKKITQTAFEVFGSYGGDKAEIPQEVERFNSFFNILDLQIRLIHALIVAFIELIICIKSIIISQFDEISLGIGTFILAIYFSTIIAAPGEYTRLMVCMLPFMLGGIAQIANQCTKITRK